MKILTRKQVVEIMGKETKGMSEHLLFMSRVILAEDDKPLNIIHPFTPVVWFKTMFCKNNNFYKSWRNIEFKSKSVETF